MLSKYNELFESKIISYGDKIICVGNIDGVKTHNHIGIMRNNGVEFINRFSDRLHDLNGELRNNNGWVIKKEWVKLFDNNKTGHNIPLIYSNEFRNIVSYTLKFLLDYENIYYSDISYIDIYKRNDCVTFLSSSSIDKLKPGEDPWNNQYRQSIKFGRFLNKIIDDNASMIENYVNDYKFSYKLNKNEFNRFKICKGINMAKWFLEKNYVPVSSGTLKLSCMRHIKSQSRLTIYIDNPNKIRMLYLIDNNGKLLGRALVWRLDEPENRIYMDKIYYAEDYIEKLFLDYANKNNFLTRDYVIKKGIKLIVKLNKDYGSPRKNPYMDTFRFFIKDGLYLTNKFNNFKSDEYWEYIDHD